MCCVKRCRMNPFAGHPTTRERLRLRRVHLPIPRNLVPRRRMLPVHPGKYAVPPAEDGLGNRTHKAQGRPIAPSLDVFHLFRALALVSSWRRASCFVPYSFRAHLSYPPAIRAFRFPALEPRLSHERVHTSEAVGSAHSEGHLRNHHTMMKNQKTMRRKIMYHSQRHPCRAAILFMRRKVPARIPDVSEKASFCVATVEHGTGCAGRGERKRTI